jgi:hypothetical protein
MTSSLNCFTPETYPNRGEGVGLWTTTKTAKGKGWSLPYR